MTAGTYISDHRVSVVPYEKTMPNGPTFYGTPSLEGSYFSKAWSGVDYPASRPTYVTYRYWSRPYNRWYTVRERTDVPTRKKTEFHPYSMSLIFRNSGTFTYLGALGAYENFVGGDRLFGGEGYSGDPKTPGWTANDTLKLQDKLREKVAGSDFNAGVALGEAGQTLDLITGTATTLYNAYRQVRRGDFAGAALALGVRPRRGSSSSTLTENVASRWLELQYGWLPLLKDVHGAAEFLAKTLNFPIVQTYRVKRSKKYRLVVQSNSYRPTSGKRFHARDQGLLIARLEEVDVAKLSGLQDPASVAWELLPYSFVADWFIPIGTYLANRGLATSLTGEYCQTITRKSIAYLELNPAVINVTRNGYNNTFKVQMNRTVTGSLQVPLPQWKTLGEVLSWKRAANAIALLVTSHGSSRGY